MLRGYYDLAGLQLASNNVLTGTGVDSFGDGGAQYMPADVAASDLVHNGWIQALVDGGVLLAVPVVVVTLIPALRALLRLLRGRRAGANAVQVGASAAVLVLLGHALFDFDWQYPSLLALYAILASLLPWRATVSGSPSTPSCVVRSGLVAVSAAVAVAACWAGTAIRYPNGEPPSWLAPAEHVVSLDAMRANLHTADGDQALLEQAATLDEASFRAVMDRTAALAGVNPELAQLRALAMGRRGSLDEMRVTSDGALPGDPRPPVILTRAEVLWLSGEHERAREWVSEQYRRITGLQGNVPVADLEEWLASHQAEPEGAEE